MFFDSSNQNSQQLNNDGSATINFNPVIAYGDSNTQTPSNLYENIRKTDQTQTPRSDQSTTASVGVGVGGDGSGGAVGRTQNEMGAGVGGSGGVSSLGNVGRYLPYIAFALGGAGLLFALAKRR